jgi:dUTP pyrophosphatase
MEVEVKVQLSKGAGLPHYKHSWDSGMDIELIEDAVILPKQTVLLPTGLRFAIPNGYELQGRPRSGLSLRTKLRVSNSPGTIDSEYRDEVGIILDNIGDDPIYLKKGDRVIQIVLQEVPRMKLLVVNDICEVEGNRNGGFGSTGGNNNE